MDVDERRAAYVTEHEGATYYFCSPVCKRTFDNGNRSFVIWKYADIPDPGFSEKTPTKGSDPA
jgi:YHS domain-containing protein